MFPLDDAFFWESQIESVLTAGDIDGSALFWKGKEKEREKERGKAPRQNSSRILAYKQTRIQRSFAGPYQTNSTHHEGEGKKEKREKKGK